MKLVPLRLSFYIVERKHIHIVGAEQAQHRTQFIGGIGERSAKLYADDDSFSIAAKLLDHLADGIGSAWRIGQAGPIEKVNTPGEGTVNIIYEKRALPAKPGPVGRRGGQRPWRANQKWMREVEAILTRIVYKTCRTRVMRIPAIEMVAVLSHAHLCEVTGWEWDPFRELDERSYDWAYWGRQYQYLCRTHCFRWRDGKDTIMAFPLDIKLVHRTEAKLGRKLPPGYIAKMSRNNGGAVVTQDDDWELYPIFDDSDRKRLKRTCNDIVRETASAREWHTFPPGALAIGSNGGGDLLILLADLESDRYGEAAHWWDHETGEVEIVADAFEELAQDP